jgi:predicted enzyme related to lactoylglutathione lyase
MAVLRPHPALTVSDVERAIPFYEALFGTQPQKDVLAAKERLVAAGT